MSDIVNNPATMPTKKPTKIGSKSWSRMALLAAGGIFTVALFLLDAQALQVQPPSTSSECLFYVLGFASTYVYVSFVSQGRRAPCASSLRVQVSASEAARAFVTEARARLSSLLQLMHCPRPAEPRPSDEQPPVPFWALAALHIVITLVAVGLFSMPFLGAPEAIAADGEALLDAPRCQQDELEGKSLRQWPWLIASFGLSSGLCVVHPLQSGLILAT